MKDLYCSGCHYWDGDFVGGRCLTSNCPYQKSIDEAIKETPIKEEPLVSEELKAPLTGEQYDYLLDEWFEMLCTIWEASDELAKNQDDYTYQQGRSAGYSEGLRMAAAILRGLEKKEIKRR